MTRQQRKDLIHKIKNYKFHVEKIGVFTFKSLDSFDLIRMNDLFMT